MGLVGSNSGTVTDSSATASPNGDGDSDKVGGLVGSNSTSGKVIASHATGAVDGGAGTGDEVGGLVGSNASSSEIIASYATGAVDGGTGNNDEVGGLLGSNSGTVIASYATGAVSGGAGTGDEVGGLVGHNQTGSSIIAAYATGNANGDGDNSDLVGGLVGKNDASITASYAIGDASGGGGTSDEAGSLVGNGTTHIEESYGFGTVDAETTTDARDGTNKPSGVTEARDLTDDDSDATTYAGDSWDDTAKKTKGAWDFGTDRTPPKLRYADYDDTGGTNYCADFPSCVAGSNVIPDQYPDGDDDGVPDFVDACTGSPADFDSTTASDNDRDGCRDSDEDVDDDGDGLIEIRTLDDLASMHNNLAGTSYDDDSDDTGSTSFDACGTDTTNGRGSICGAPTSPPPACTGRTTTTNLCGYELMKDLDFAKATDYASGSFNYAWRPATTAPPSGASTLSADPSTAVNTGFPGIGDATSGGTYFSAVFDGNGHSISNLYMRNTANTDQYIGLFRRTTSSAEIRNVGVLGNLYGGSAIDYVGILVGYNDASITVSYADGDADGAGARDYVGGLVGYNDASITASYATGDVDGGAGNRDSVGGLVGKNNGSSASITASYAEGDVDGGLGSRDYVGGLVGNNEGSITASYATGDVDGGAGRDYVGGLVGWNEGSSASITASYAVGDADGGAGNSDKVGGLVGYNDGSSASITASYAVGDADGGAGNSDKVGGLVGDNNGTITKAYGFGTANGETVNTDGSPPSTCGGNNSACTLNGLNITTSSTDNTQWNAGTSWDATANNTKGAWDFGTDRTPPKLKYADYDGSGGTNYCADFPSCVAGNNVIPDQYPDGDGDGVPDFVDTVCTSSPAAFTSTTTTDYDADGCRDSDEDLDDDNDGVLDAGLDGTLGNDDDDNCRIVANGASETYTPGVGDQTNSDTDALGDACDPDDDNDGRNDLGADGRAGGAGVNADDNCRTVSNADQTDTDSDGAGDACDVDDDGDGLIEIRSLDMLHHIRHNLAGTSYDDEESDSALGTGFDACGTDTTNGRGSVCGAPTTATTDCATSTGGVFLCGYELSQNLDFAKASDYANNTRNATWCPVVITCNSTTTTDAGFPGIGDATESGTYFSAVFDGNGHSISNLYMRNTASTGQYIGLFRRTTSSAEIRNVGVIGNLYGGGGADYVGGLVGYNGGSASITASYATGDADGGGGRDYVGVLVGYNNASIVASYAVGDADGGAGNIDCVGGLVGWNDDSIVASYAVGDADGGAGNTDYVGGLVGYNNASIVASYAVGDADGGAGTDDEVGGLLGARSPGTSSITKAYGFGNTSNGTANIIGSPPSGCGGTCTASNLTLTAANNGGTEWDATASNTKGAWDFGTDRTPPKLKYADYDGGAGTTYQCSDFPSCNAIINDPNQYPDGDGDGVPDFVDTVCASSPAAFTSTTTTDHDADGCLDDDLDIGGGVTLDAEDDDDDNDGIKDLGANGVAGGGDDDQCSKGSTGWTSSSTTDNDGDGCQDSHAEDLDDDNDGVLDLGVNGVAGGGDDDQCSKGATGWTSSSTTDNDGDGCLDEDLDLGGGVTLDAEDDDDDGDGRNDLGADNAVGGVGVNADDNCRTVANGAAQASIVGVGNQTNSDTDALGDACDPDDDDDGRNDLGADGRAGGSDVNADDNCRTVANGAAQVSTPGVGNQTDTDSDGAGDACDVDDDNNGLIEIRSLDMLHHIHYNLAGTSYDDESADTGSTSFDACGTDTTNGSGSVCGAAAADTTATTMNCGAGKRLCGYELTRDLNFATATDYESGSLNYAWRPATTTNPSDASTLSTNPSTAMNTGFPGIGDATSGGTYFSAVFDGNGHRIRNLYMRNTASTNHQYIGLFRCTASGAKIRNVGVIGNLYGGAGGYDYVGGLVGYNNSGSITASYAEGDADGGDGGYDYVGGLVGYNNASITASYATGDADGGGGNVDVVGGLVGDNSGSITASYATGDVYGGAGNNDQVGGLVGWNNNASITASYATGDVDGGAGNSDNVSGLVGKNNGTITKAYGFGTVTGGTEDTNGTPPSFCGSGQNALCTASTLTLYAVNCGNGSTCDVTGDEWNVATSNTNGAWVFPSTASPAPGPRLRYANYGMSYPCSLFPSNVTCGTTLLAYQYDLDNDGVFDTDDVDDDGDGLIEIRSLDMLHNIRYNLAGTSYDDEENDGPGNLGDTTGAPTAPTADCTSGRDHDGDSNTPSIYLCGYELTRDLNFATAADYASGSVNYAWRPATTTTPSDANTLSTDPSTAINTGFPGIGGATGSGTYFSAVFDGNGHSVSNLYMRNTANTGEYIGLFRRTTSSAEIRNVGVEGNLYGGAGGSDSVGILVGWNGGSIVASYVTGDADGGAGIGDYVGGLVGRNAGDITASYADGDAKGGDGDYDYVGGLAGYNNGDITASYADGDAKGGAGTGDYVGGLVGWFGSSGSITASYATGNADGGAGAGDEVGVLVGKNQGSITDAYGFGTTSNGTANTTGTPPSTCGGNNSACTLNGLNTATSSMDNTQWNAGASWNAATSDTLNAWDFGTNSTAPKLKYADYDGSATDYSCSNTQFQPYGAAITCGTTHLPGQ